MNKRIDAIKVFLIGGFWFVGFWAVLCGIGVEFFGRGKIEPVVLIIPVIFLGISLIYLWLGIKIQNSSAEEVGVRWYRVFTIARYLSFAVVVVPACSLLIAVGLVATKIVMPRNPILLPVIQSTACVGVILTLISICLFLLFYRYQKYAGIQVETTMREVDKFFSMMKSLKTVFVGIRDNDEIWGIDFEGLLVWTTKEKAHILLYDKLKETSIRIDEVSIDTIPGKALKMGVNNIVLDFINPYGDHHTLTIDEFNGYIS